MIGSMSRAPKYLGQAVNSRSVTDGDGHYQSPKVLPSSLGKMVSDRLEKTLQFFWNFADCNHMASPTISTCTYKYYRQSRPFLFDVFSNHKFENRSV